MLGVVAGLQSADGDVLPVRAQSVEVDQVDVVDVRAAAHRRVAHRLVPRLLRSTCGSDEEVRSSGRLMLAIDVKGTGEVKNFTYRRSLVDVRISIMFLEIELQKS